MRKSPRVLTGLLVLGLFVPAVNAQPSPELPFKPRAAALLGPVAPAAEPQKSEPPLLQVRSLPAPAALQPELPPPLPAKKAEIEIYQDPPAPAPAPAAEGRELPVLPPADGSVYKFQAIVPNYTPSAAAVGKAHSPLGDMEFKRACDAPAADCGLGGFIAGVGFYYIHPIYGSNPAFVSTINQTVTNPNTTITQMQEFHWDNQMAPRAWLGYMGENGLGIVASYWHFQGDPASVVISHSADPKGIQTFGSTLGALPIPVRSNFPPIPADRITINSALRLTVIDVEAAWMGNADRLTYKATFGGRYADLHQFYSASLINAGNPPNFQQNEANTFAGGGPTVGGELEYRLFRRVSLYGNGRFSLLFGHSQQDANQTQTGINPSLSFTANNGKEITMPVGELEVGLSWHASWKRLGFTAKTGFAAQMWWDAGSASIPAGGAFPALGAQTPQGVFFPVSAASHSNLGFIGWTASLGIQY